MTEKKKNKMKFLLGENVGCWYEREKRRNTRDEQGKRKGRKASESSNKEIVYF